ASNLMFSGNIEMDLLNNIAIAVGVLALVWITTIIRWYASRGLADITPDSSEIELSIHHDPTEEKNESLTILHVAEHFPIPRLTQFSLLLLPTTIAWYFADKTPEPHDAEWSGMYYATIVIYGGYAAMLLVMNIAKLQEYRNKRIFLEGAKAVLEHQRASK